MKHFVEQIRATGAGHELFTHGQAYSIMCCPTEALDKVVRTTIYLVSMADFATVNEIYGRHFGEHRPARATVAVKELPKAALVEVDCIALAP